MHVAQEIGSYAGLAAVVGLAVLSALYFSQARDVKRLKEWAGRAPERAPEPQTQGVVSRPAVPQPVRPAAPGTPKPAAGTAAAASAAAAAAGTQVKPAQASATGAATPAAQQAAGADKPDEPEDESADAAKPEGETATPAAASAAGATETDKETGDAKDADAAAASPANGSGATAAPTPAPATATPAAQGAATPAGGKDTHPPTVPPRAPVRRAPSGRPGGAPAPSSRPPKSTILPSYDEVQNPAPWYRRLAASPLYLVLAIVAVLVVLGAAAFGVTKLTSSDSGSSGASTSQPSPPGNGGSGKSTPEKPAAIVPSKVTVAVLNGTSVPGLAAQIGDKLTAAKFKLGNVSNSNDGGARAESVVYYASGAKKEAELVSRKLRISQREPIDAQTQQLAGDARVVVIAGADQTR